VKNLKTSPRKPGKATRRFAEVLKTTALIYPTGSPYPWMIDRKFRSKLSRVRWKYLPNRKRCRGYFGRGVTRQFLHRYILSLAGRQYSEVTFANGDPHDCRLVNLKPYDRSADGASRSRFKSSTGRFRGVYYHKVRGRWLAQIRCRGRLTQIGSYLTAEAAAKAYMKAWVQAYPNRKPPSN